MSSRTFSETFIQAARLAMMFLIDDFGFTETEIHLAHDETLASTVCWIIYSKEYESGQRLFVDLNLAPFRFESYIDLARGNSARDARFSIYELHAIINGSTFPQRTTDLYKAAFDPEMLIVEFDRLARVLRECGGRFFKNDNSLWSEIEAMREKNLGEETYRQVSREAEIAFKQGHWDQAVRLLQSLGNRVTKLQQARQSYAMKRLNTG